MENKLELLEDQINKTEADLDRMVDGEDVTNGNESEEVWLEEALRFTIGAFNEVKGLKNVGLLIDDIHQTAKSKGWWDTPRSFGEVVALVHSELSEALEFERNKTNLENKGINYLIHYTADVKPEYPEDGPFELIQDALLASNENLTGDLKPDGLLPELADVIVRIFDYVGYLGEADNFMDILLDKHKFNKTRSYKHGGKTL